MSTRTIGGTLDMAALGALLGDRPGNSRLNQPQYAVALADAHDHLRRACSALAAADVPSPQQAAELARMHARLRDELAALETIGRPL